MKTLGVIRLLGLGAVLLAAQPAAAHHSGAMFEPTRTVTINGVVKEWKWANPHGWLTMTAAGPGGKPVEWGVECSAINILARKGWSARSFKPGDKIVAVMRPMKDGSPAGLLMTVQTADGGTLKDHDY